jgi:hypothetical protein
MLTEKELTASGYRNSLGVRFASYVDIWTRFMPDGGMLTILRDVTTGATSEPFYTHSARPNSILSSEG